MKVSLKFACLLVVLLFIAGNKAHGQQKRSANLSLKNDFYLKNNDRVVFYGDSITEQAFYTNFIETYVVTRFPNLHVSFTNSGWSGDKIWGGGGGSLEERLRRDVFPHQPTVVTAMFGMNDGCYIEFNADCFKAFTENYEKFLVSVKENSPGGRLTLLQPSPFDDWTDSNAWRLAPPVKGGYNNVLIRYGQFVKELAQKNNLIVADMNAPLVEAIQKAQISDKEFAQKIIPDRIHPSKAGGLLMASVLLKSWNAPVIVTAVELDAASGKIVRADKTEISGFKAGKKISWTQTDEALPLPIDTGDKTVALIVGLSDIIENLDRQSLKVTNLSAPRYVLEIDGEEIGSWTKEELAKGFNLAVLKTPMLKQAMAVHLLTEQHNKVHFARWREFQVPFEKENLAAAPKVLSALDATETELVKRQRAAAQPTPHRYELIPQT